MKPIFVTLLVLIATSTYSQTSEGYQEAMFGSTQNGILNHLATELTYPDEARLKNIDGTVLFKFVVDTTGHIDSLVNIYTPSFILSQEAARVILLSDGKWTPAYKKGVKIQSTYYLPVKFILEDGGSRKHEFEEGNYYFKEGLQYYNDGSENEAVNAFNIAYKLNPERIDAVYNLVLIYQNSGNYDLTCFYIQKIKEYKGKVDKEMMADIMNTYKIYCK